MRKFKIETTHLTSNTTVHKVLTTDGVFVCQSKNRLSIERMADFMNDTVKKPEDILDIPWSVKRNIVTSFGVCTQDIYNRLI